jgi:hypothetical protein
MGKKIGTHFVFQNILFKSSFINYKLGHEKYFFVSGQVSRSKKAQFELFIYKFDTL